MNYQKQTLGEDSLFEIEEQGIRYGVRSLNDGNSTGLAEYQRLRGITFVQRLGWQIPVDAEGKDVDRYDDVEAKSFVCSHGIYGIHDQEHLLGGVRIFTLRSWSDSMIENEFHTNGMIPHHILRLLKSQYCCTDLLEATRLCVQPSPIPPFRQLIVRDLIYAPLYVQAQATGRGLVLALVDSLYYRVMCRERFALREIYTHRLDHRQGYALVIINLWETVSARGGDARITRALAFCA